MGPITTKRSQQLIVADRIEDPVDRGLSRLDLKTTVLELDESFRTQGRPGTNQIPLQLNEVPCESVMASGRTRCSEDQLSSTRKRSQRGQR